MNSAACVASSFIALGLTCALAPEQVAEFGVRLDSTNKDSARQLLKRYAHITRWTGRIVGGILTTTGVIILLASGP